MVLRPFVPRVCTPVRCVPVSCADVRSARTIVGLNGCLVLGEGELDCGRFTDCGRLFYWDWVLSLRRKIVRAHGGCLGIRRRRRTCKAAISYGELQRSVDPWISEWGNPIDTLRGGRTGRTETSK